MPVSDAPVRPNPLFALRRSTIALASATGLLLAGVSIAPVASAAPGDEVADFYPYSDMFGAAPLTIGDEVYFAAAGLGAGVELWRSDGTNAGTQLVVDAVPGAEGVFPTHGLVQLGDKIIFTGVGGSMRSIDLASGVSVVLPTGDAYVQATGKYVDSSGGRIVVGDMVLFGAYNPSIGEGSAQLWRTDGTPEGTVPLVTVPFNDPSQFHAVPGGAVFSTDFGVWFSDGTTSGTIELSPAGFDRFDVLGVAGDRAVIRAEKFTVEGAEYEVWATDGSVAGTQSLAPTFGSITSSVEWGDQVFFVADSSGDIWVTDATISGTYLVEQGSISCDPEMDDWLCPSIVLYSAEDGVYFADHLSVMDMRANPFDLEQWELGLHKTVGVPDSAEFTSSPSRVASVLGVPMSGGALTEVRYHSPEGEGEFEEVLELWFLSAAGGEDAQLLTEFESPLQSIEHLATLDGLAVLQVHADEPESPFSQLWVSDGTVAGTHQIVPVEPGDTGEPEPEPVTAITFDVPAVGGVLQVGEVLSAVVSNVSPADAALSYQWLRNGKSISKAKGVTYVPTSSDRGKQLSVKVTANSPGLKSVSKTSAKTVKIGYGVLDAAGEVSIAGTPQVGQKLTAVVPGFSVPKVSFKYQWLRDGKKISKATKSSYTLTKSDLGKQITVQVTASKSGYSKMVLTTDAPTIDKGVLAVDRVPTIKGTAKVGKTLTASSKGWSASSVSLRYAWYADGVLVQFSSSSKYKLTWEDRGTSITVKVRGTKEGYVPVELAEAPESALYGPVK